MSCNDKKYIIREVTGKHIIQQDLVSFPDRRILRFTGGVTIQDTDDATIINIQGGAGGGGASLTLLADFASLLALNPPPSDGDLAFVRDAKDDPNNDIPDLAGGNADNLNWGLYVWDDANTQWQLLSTYQSTIFDTTLADNVASPGVGGIPQGTTMGQLRGQQISEILKQAIFPRILYQYVAPTISVVGTPPAPNGNTATKLFEAGFQATFNIIYNYQQNDAGASTRRELERLNVNIGGSNIVDTLNAPGIPDQGSITVTSFTSNSPAGYNFRVKMSHIAGPVFPDNYGNNSPGNIQAGVVTSNTVRYDFIYPYFYGVAPGGTRPTLTGADILAGTKVIAKANKSIDISWGPGANYIWFAVPVVTGLPTAIQNSKDPFTQWTDLNDANNAGAIGGGSAAGNLFPDPVDVTVTLPVSGQTITYRLYLSNYATVANSNYRLS